MVMFQDPSLQAYYEQQAALERAKLLAEQEAANQPPQTVQPPPTQTTPAQTTPTQTTNTGLYAAPPAGYYISGYVNGKPIYSPISGVGEPIYPSEPNYPVQPTPPAMPTPPANTEYYPDQKAWEDAGKPVTDENKSVIIGTPPKPGEPSTGAFVVNPDTGEKTVVPFSEYKPEESLGYVPTVEQYKQHVDELAVKSQEFKDKWDSFIQDNTFNGTEEQYQEYLKESDELNQTVASVGKQYDYLSTKLDEQKAAQAKWESELKEQSPELYELYIKNPDAFSKELERLQAEKIASQEEYDRWQNAINRLSVYKQEDGTYNIVDYLKVRPIDYSNPDWRNSANYKLLSDAGFTQEQIVKANMYAQGYNPEQYKLSPSDAHRPNWFDQRAMQLAAWQENFRKQQLSGENTYPSWIKDTTNLQRLLDGAAGVLSSAVTMFPLAFVSIGQAATHPENIPSMAKNMFNGFIDMAKTAVDPMAPSYDIASSVFNIGMMADIGTGALKTIKTFVHPKGIPKIAMAGESSTGRISLLKFDTPEGRIRAGEALGEHLKKTMSEGDDIVVRTAVKAADGTELEFVSIKSPIQQQVGDLLLHGDNKGLKFIETENLPLNATNPGLKFIDTNRPSLETGKTVIGDLHESVTGIIDDINSGYSQPIIKPDGTWSGTKQTVVQMGDIVDRGSWNNTGYFKLRDMFNKLYDESSNTGGNVVRVIGNHELAYLMDDAIRGVKYMNRNKIKSTLLDDVNSGRAVAAYAKDGQLYTHAGVSLDKFKEWRGKTAEEVATDINNRFKKAVQTNNFTDPIFDRGRVEAYSASSRWNGSNIGGIFWLRPQESVSGINLGFKQFVGHNPSNLGVRQLVKNFVETDVHRWEGGRGVYHDTGKITPEVIEIIVEPTLEAGESGMYFGTTLHPAYTQGKGSPGVIMAVTDKKFVDSIPNHEKVLANVSTSDAALKNAPEGLYTPNKTWFDVNGYPAYEPEITASPGTKFSVPKAETDLYNRLITGKSADFFTSLGTEKLWQFVPVKIMIDQRLIDSGAVKIPSIADLYAAKLNTVRYALETTRQILRHPEAVTSDIVQLIKQVKNSDIERLMTSDVGLPSDIPGFRDVWIETNYANKLKATAEQLRQAALDALKKSGKKLDSDAVTNLLNDAVRREYQVNLSRLIKDFGNIGNLYNKDNRTRYIFEQAYLQYLKDNIQSLTKVSDLESSAISDIERASLTRSSVPRLTTVDIIAKSIDTTRDTESESEMPPTEATPPGEDDTGTTEEPRPPVTIEEPITPRDGEQEPGIVPRTISPVVEPELPFAETPEPPRTVEPPYPVRVVPNVRVEPVRVFAPATTLKPTEKILLPESESGDKKTIPTIHSPVTWRQGFVHWTIFPPANGWNSPGEPTLKCTKLPPSGAYIVTGAGSAYSTIQALGGNADVILNIDMGAFDVKIESPSKSAGKKGSIKYKLDKYNMNIQPLTVKGVKVSD